MANDYPVPVNAEFQTTQWSLFNDFKTLDQARSKAATERLIHNYWAPVYCFLRRKGYSDTDALDLTQGFFHEIVLERQLFCQADQHKGRFRTFLLTTLTHYIKEQYRKDHAQKRHPIQGVVSLNTTHLNLNQANIPTNNPSQAFMHAWAASLVNRVLATLELDFQEDGKGVYWEIFCERVINPILYGDQVLSLPELCRKYNIDTEKKASNIIVTVKRRFRIALRRILAETVDSDSDIDQELSELINILSQGHAA